MGYKRILSEYRFNVSSKATSSYQSSLFISAAWRSGSGTSASPRPRERRRSPASRSDRSLSRELPELPPRRRHQADNEFVFIGHPPCEMTATSLVYAAPSRTGRHPTFADISERISEATGERVMKDARPAPREERANPRTSDHA
jgi:hypothetical protein